MEDQTCGAASPDPTLYNCYKAGCTPYVLSTGYGQWAKMAALVILTLGSH